LSVLAFTILGMRIFLSLIMVITLGVYTPANAEPVPKSLVLIDTGFDTSIETISKSVIFESCVMDWSMCPNSRTFQEGTGAATISSSLLSAPGITHGTQMASIAITTNPAQKLILLRLVAYNSRGQRMPVYESSLIQAFQWIARKRLELNIGAVAMAQGHHSFSTSKNYCPKSPVLEKLIIDLKLNEVPVFFPAGNAGDKSRIDWPACIPAAIAIGAIDSSGQIAKYSNYDRVLNDFYVLGTSSALLPGGGNTTATGTSVSTVVAASYWLKIMELKPELKLADVTQLFRNTGPIIFDSKFRYGRKMDIEAALTLLSMSNS
jgi:hypothetical protein